MRRTFALKMSLLFYLSLICLILQIHLHSNSALDNIASARKTANLLRLYYCICWSDSYRTNQNMPLL